MDAIILQVLNGLDKGGAYALIALGLTLIFGTLGVVNFAHGALFMLGAFCAVAFTKLLTISERVRDESVTFFEAYKEIPYLEIWWGDTGRAIVDWAVPLSVLVAIPVMLLIGLAMERGLIRFFYKRSHAEQILVTFGLAIVLQEIVKHYFGANPIPLTAPPLLAGSADIGQWFGVTGISYPMWRIVYFLFSLVVIAAVFAFLQLTTFGMVVRAGMADQYRPQVLDRLRAGRGRRGPCRRHVHADPRAELPSGDGFPGLVIRRRRRRGHGIASRRGGCRLLAGSPAVLRLADRGQGHRSGHRPDHHLSRRRRRPARPSTRLDGPQGRHGGLIR